MKKFINLVALAALLFAPAIAKAQDCTTAVVVSASQAFVEDFEGGSIPSCWTQSGYPAWTVGTGDYENSTGAHGGSKNARIYGNGSNSEIELVSPVLDLTALGAAAQLSFWHIERDWSGDHDYLAVKYRTSATDSWHELASWTAAVETWTEETILLPNVSATYQIAFVATENYGYGVGVDDIMVGLPPTCLPVTGFAASTVDSSSIALSWSDLLNSGASYTVSYWPSAGSDTLAVETSGITGNSLTVDNLAVNTAYTFRIVANCTATDASTAAEATGRTACGSVVMPFSEGFDDGTNNEAPQCWIMARTAGVSTYDYSTYTYVTRQYPIITSPGRDGSAKALLFEASSTADTIIIASPSAIPLAGNSIYASFWLRAYLPTWGNYSLSFEAGVMTSTGNASTFVPLLTVEERDDTWRQYEFTTANLDAAASYFLALRYTGSTSSAYAYLDDILVREDNGCNRPSMATIDSVGPYSATLHWTSGGANATAYDIFYNTTNSLAGAQVVAGVADTAHTLTGLAPQTTYYAWVRTACGTDSADAKPFGSFTTQLTCASVVNVAVGETNYTAANISWGYNNAEGFASQGAELTLTNLTDTNDSPIVVTVDSATTSYLFTGLQPSSSYSLAITNTCNTGSQIDSASVVTVGFMTRSCATVDGGSESLSTYTNPLNANYNYAYSQNLYTREEMPHIDTIRGIAFKTTSGYGSDLNVDIYLGNTAQTSLADSLVPYSQLTRVATNYSYSISAGWNVITFDSAFVYDGVGSLVVAVDNNTGSYNGNLYWMQHPTQEVQCAYNYSDNTNYDPATVVRSSLSTSSNALDIQFVATCTIPTCFAPMSLALVDADSSSLSLSWATSGTESSFVVGYKAPADADYTYLAAVTDTTYTISGLNAATSYSLRVGSICGDDTVWSRLTAQTTCGLIAIDNATPYYEDFDAYAEDVLPPCWDYDEAGITHFDGGLFWRSMQGGTIAVLPSIDAPLSDLEVSFKAKMGTASQGDRWVIGAANSQGELLEWIDTTEIVTGQSRSSFTVFTVRLNHYTGNGTRIAITHTYNGSDWSLLDSLTVRYIPQCLPVAALTGHNLIHADSMYFSWRNPGGASSFDVAYDTAGTIVDNAVNLTSVNDTTYLLPALASGGKYTIWVRSNCGGTTSEWTSLTFAAGEVVMPQNGADTVQGCGFVVYDNGGPYGGYESGSTSTLVVRPATAGDVVVIKAGSWFYPYTDSYSHLYIYDGEGTDGEVLYSGSGIDTLQNDLVGEDGAVTIHFVAGSYVNHGYELFTACQAGPTCSRPQSVAVTAIDTTSATIGWVSTANDIHLYYRQQGDGDWTLVEATSTPVTLSGLTPSTTYEYYLRAICSTTDSSNATTTRSFSTEDLPFNCAAPVISATVTDSTATVTITGTAGSYEVEIVQGAWTGSMGNEVETEESTYTFSGLTAGTQYTIGVRSVCEVDMWDYEYSEWVTTGITTTAPGVTQHTVSASTANSAMGSATVSPSGNVNEGTSVTFTATANNGYHFVAWTNGTTQVSTENPYVVTVSADLALTATFEADAAPQPECGVPTNVTATDVTATTARIDWTPAEGQNQWEIKYNGSTLTTTTHPTLLDNLTGNTDYTVSVRAICDDGHSAWSNEISFHTLAAQQEGIEDALGNAISLYPNPATTSVTIEGLEGNAKVSIVDMNGREVYATTTRATTLVIDLSGTAQGAYFVRITGENTTAIRKLIVR